MDYIAAILADKNKKKPHVEIARKVFLTFPTFVFNGDEETEFEIRNIISEYFGIPITSVQFVGSAKIGRSFVKKTNFTPGVSDLDVALIDPSLFTRYHDKACLITKGFSDSTTFSSNDKRDSFLYYLQRGIFCPRLAPRLDEFEDINIFFLKLSEKYRDKFKDISVRIYLSQTSFEVKQRKAITNLVITGGLRGS